MDDSKERMTNHQIPMIKCDKCLEEAIKKSGKAGI
jgi:hypothetical protein